MGLMGSYQVAILSKRQAHACGRPPAFSIHGLVAIIVFYTRLCNHDHFLYHDNDNFLRMALQQ